MMNKTGRTGIAIQVVVGIVIVICIYMLSLWIIQRDQLVSDVNTFREPRLHVKILDGYSTGHSLANRTWSTINQDAANFVSLKRSYNRRGGAQYSYSFWMKISKATDSNVGERTILLRGDKEIYKWARVTNTDRGFPSTTNSATTIFNDVLVKSPRIRFGGSYGTFVIELNTLADPNAKIFIGNDAAPTFDGTLVKDERASADPSLRHNAMALTRGRWAMYTFTFEDHVAINDFEDGIMVRFYLNDTLYHTQAMRSSMRQNYGDLYLMPTISASVHDEFMTRSQINARKEAEESSVLDGTIGNLSYFNYALSINDVNNLFRNGPPTYPSKDMMSGATSQPVYLSEYNRLDVYNT